MYTPTGYQQALGTNSISLPLPPPVWMSETHVRQPKWAASPPLYAYIHSTHIDISTCMQVHISKYIPIQTHIYVYTQIYLYVYYICSYTYVCAYMCINMCVHIYVCHIFAAL